VLRWLLWVFAALPGIAGARGALGESIANRPQFTEAPDPLPFLEFARLIAEIPGGVWATFALGVIIGWTGNLFLTAGAVDIVGRRDTGGVKVLRTVFDTGVRHLWVYVRIALFAVLFIGVGSRLLAVIFERLGEHGQLAGWSAETLVFNLGITRGLILLLWLTIVGVFALWSRVIVVADGRRYVRRLPSLVVRLWLRRPVGSLVVHLVLVFATLFASSGVLAGWRQSSARSTGWIVLWLGVLMAQALIWHWRIRASRLIWSASDLEDLRARPDAPWRLFRRIRERWRKRPAPPPAGPHGALGDSGSGSSAMQ
jgi:hypothetical protein